MSLYNRIVVALASPDSWQRLRDFVLAMLIYALPTNLRRGIFAGEKHLCPVCQSPLRSFLRLNRPFFAWCPICRSLQRHRLVGLLLERLIIPRLPAQNQAHVLHFAPEQGLTERFRQLAPNGYVSLDRYDHQAMLLADICAIPLRSALMDCIYCSHVLEHIEHDRQAMHELVRVLRPNGIALILVPLLGEHTSEDARITSPIEREHAFGQHDHVRWYGSDIRQRLTEAGFAVEVIRTEDVATAADIERYGLEAGETVFVCTPSA